MMKKFMNAPETVTDEELVGLCFCGNVSMVLRPRTTTLLIVSLRNIFWSFGMRTKSSPLLPMAQFSKESIPSST